MHTGAFRDGDGLGRLATWLVPIAGLLVVFQFVAPVAMTAWVAWDALVGVFQAPDVRVRGAALHGDRLIVPTVPGVFGPEGEGELALLRIDPRQSGPPEIWTSAPAPEHGLGEVQVVSTGDRLWAVGRRFVVEVNPERGLGGQSLDGASQPWGTPFGANGALRLAITEDERVGWLEWQQGRWAPGPLRGAGHELDDPVVRLEDDDWWIWDSTSEAERVTHIPAKGGPTWGAFVHDWIDGFVVWNGVPTLLGHGGDYDQGEVVLVQWQGGEWNRLAVVDVGSSVNELAAFPRADGSLLLLTDGMFSEVRTFSVQPDGRVGARSVHNSGPSMLVFAGWIAMGSAAPLLATLGLGLCMGLVLPRYRHTQVTAGGHTWELASVGRRCWARVVDTVVFSVVPLGFLGARVAVSGIDQVHELEAVAVCIVWGIPLFFLLAWVEGRTGKTPGKALFGIAVVGLRTGRPVGFGRSMARQALMMVDGIFHWLVGLVVLCLSPRWQRLGDLAAHSVVVRAAAQASGASSDAAMANKSSASS